MSLDFDVSNIKDYQTVTTSPFDSTKWHPVTEALIFACMAVDLGQITEKNFEEFYERYALWQMVNGAALANDRGEIYITKKDVELHIGLSTNVSNATRKQFNDKLMRAMFRKLEYSKTITGNVKYNDGEVTEETSAYDLIAQRALELRQQDLEDMEQDRLYGAEELDSKD